MEIIQTVLFAAFVAGVATGVVSGLVSFAAMWVAMFQRQPGVGLLDIQWSLLMLPEHFSPAGQKTRRIYLRGLQGFLAAFLLALCAGHFSTKIAGTDIPLIVELVMIAVVVLLLAWLQKLSRIPSPG